MNTDAKKILIIDDDTFLIKLMEMALTKSGYQVVSASQGKEAIEIVKRESVDLIVVDMMMPEMDGLGFLQWLRQEGKLGIPTLVQTGMASPKMEQQVMDAGANALIYKPVKVPTLIEKIKELEKLL